MRVYCVGVCGCVCGWYDSIVYHTGVLPVQMCMYVCYGVVFCTVTDYRHPPTQVLKAERPDVDAKRSDLLKLQGEFMLKLRHLEQSLLQALNEVKGRILDDDRIITQLESLKREAAEVQRKVEETDVVMAEVERVSLQYRPLSSSCSSIYFTLESLNQVCVCLCVCLCVSVCLSVCVCVSVCVCCLAPTIQKDEVPYSLISYMTCYGTV